MSRACIATIEIQIERPDPATPGLPGRCCGTAKPLPCARSHSPSAISPRKARSMSRAKR